MSMSFDLHEAIRRGEMTDVRRAIERDMSLLFMVPPGERSALSTALDLGNREMIKFLAASVTRAIRAGQVPRESLYGVIHELGEAEFLEAESEIERFLDDPDAELRYITISVLSLHWGLSRWNNRFVRALLTDEDENVRRIAAAGLGYVMRGTKDADVARLLVRKVKDNDEANSVRSACYYALRAVWLAELGTAQSVRVEAERVLAGVDELERARRVSPEEFNAAMIRWEMDWLSEVDWGFLEEVERLVS